jgi:hypothetical protein
MKTLVTIIVAGVLLTAGCLGSVGDGPTSDATPTNAGMGEGAETSSTANGEWKLSGPEKALLEAGSFTATWTWQASDGIETAATEVRQQVDLVNERSLSTVANTAEDGVLIESFYADGVEYTRMGSDTADSEPLYMASQSEFEGDVMIYNYGYAYDSSDLDDWSLEGTTTYDGVTVRKYVYSGVDLWIGTGAWAGSDEFEVTDVEFTMLVDKNGIARYQSYRVEGTDKDRQVQWFAWEYTVQQVGSTTVEDPQWLPEALDTTH